VVGEKIIPILLLKIIDEVVAENNLIMNVSQKFMNMNSQ